MHFGLYYIFGSRNKIDTERKNCERRNKKVCGEEWRQINCTNMWSMCGARVFFY